jgi:hypothetical protein
MFRLDQLGNPTSESHAQASNPVRHIARHSLEANLFHSQEGGHANMGPAASSRPTSLQTSYSTNDVPTVKGDGFNPAITPPKAHAASYLGRIPTNSISNQLKDATQHDEPKPQNSMNQQTTLQASAPPFGPQLPTAAVNNNTVTPTTMTGFPAPFYGYGIQAYMGNPVQVNSQLQNFNPAAPYGAYPPYGNYRLAEGQAKGVAARRSGDGDSQLSRFTNFPLEHYRGELYTLCKDQHGCRYLQRKLEERNPEHVQLIFDETHMHVVELMTGS